MSGSVVPGVNGSVSSVDLELQEALRSNDPSVVARAEQRLAINDPRFGEPDLPQTVTPGASGFRQEDLGIGAKSLERIEEIQAERARVGISTPQNVADNQAREANLYTFDSGSQAQQLAILGLAAGGNISGRIVGIDLLTPEEKREKEKNEAAFAMAMDDLIGDLYQDFQDMSASMDAMEEELEEAEADAFDTLGIIQEDLVAAAQKVNEHAEKLEALKKEAEAETDPTKKAALQAQIDATQKELDDATKLYMSTAEAYGHLNGKQDAAREQFNGAKTRMEELRQQLSMATDEQEKLRIREQMEEQKRLMADARQKVEDLKVTAQTLRDVTLAGREPGGLSKERTEAFVNDVRNNPELAEIITKLSASGGLGISVTGFDGKLRSDTIGVSYVTAMAQIETIDIQSARLKEQLTGNADADIETNKRITELAQQRLQLENVVGACVINKVEQNAYMMAEAAKPADGPFKLVDNAGTVTTTFSVGLAAGALTITAHGGQTYKLDEIDEENRKAIISALKDGVANGEKLEPEVLAALNTAGANLPAVAAATPAPSIQPLDVLASASTSLPSPTLKERNMTPDQQTTLFEAKDPKGAVVGMFALAMLNGELALVTDKGESHPIAGLNPAEQKMILSSVQDGLEHGKSVAPEVMGALAAAGVAKAAASAEMPTLAVKEPPKPAVDPVVEAQMAAEQEKEAARIEQERQEKYAIERLMGGGNMSAEEFERMKKILGDSYAKKLAEENDVKVQQGLLADIGLGFLKPGGSAIVAGLFGVGLFNTIQSQLEGREIPSWQPQTNLSGILAGFYSPFAGSPEFDRYNDPNAVDPSYAPSPALAALAGLSTMFGLGGPTPQGGQQPAAQPAGPSPAEQNRLQQQEMAARMAGLNGPQYQGGQSA